MPKFPLEISRKLKKWNCQSIKVLRRGLQIKSANINQSTTLPDFALGTYEAKSSSEYTLIVNLDLPKRTSEVIIDIWGLTSNTNLQHISQSRVNVINRDAKVRFHTYPKTRYMFLTLKIQPDEDYTPDQSIVWSLNYLYIETKTAISKSVTTPPIPSNLDLKYNIECAPHTLERLDLDVNNTLKEFREYLPIRLEIHEHSLIKYLLGEETTPAYLSALKANLKYSGNGPDQDNQDKQETIQRLSKQLMEDRKEILKTSKDLEEILTKIDNLTLHKHTLESSIDNKEDNIPLQKEKHENYMRLLGKLLEGLALKSNHIKSLKGANKLPEEDQKNVNLVLDYYARRVQADRRTLEQSLQEAEAEWKTFQDETLRPVEGKQSADQGRLDKLLVHFRTQKKDSLKIKEDLDNMIVRFMIDWYQLIQQINNK
jgi:hypothetical protein